MKHRLQTSPNLQRPWVFSLFCLCFDFKVKCLPWVDWMRWGCANCLSQKVIHTNTSVWNSNKTLAHDKYRDERLRSNLSMVWSAERLKCSMYFHNEYFDSSADSTMKQKHRNGIKTQIHYLGTKFWWWRWWLWKPLFNHKGSVLSDRSISHSKSILYKSELKLNVIQRYL